MMKMAFGSACPNGGEYIDQMDQCGRKTADILIRGPSASSI